MALDPSELLAVRKKLVDSTIKVRAPARRPLQLG